MMNVTVTTQPAELSDLILHALMITGILILCLVVLFLAARVVFSAYFSAKEYYLKRHLKMLDKHRSDEE